MFNIGRNTTGRSEVPARGNSSRPQKHPITSTNQPARDSDVPKQVRSFQILVFQLGSNKESSQSKMDLTMVKLQIK